MVKYYAKIFVPISTASRRLRDLPYHPALFPFPVHSPPPPTPTFPGTPPMIPFWMRMTFESLLSLPGAREDAWGYDMLMSPNKDETVVHTCHATPQQF